MGSSVVLQTFRGLEARSVDGDSDTKCMILNINLNNMKLLKYTETCSWFDTYQRKMLWCNLHTKYWITIFC